MTSRRLLERDPGLLTEAEFSSFVVGLARLGGWNMLNTYIGPDGERVPATADGPFWKAAIDHALARLDGLGE